MTKLCAFAAALLLPVVALAQAVADPVSAPGPVSQFFVSLLPHLLQIVTGLLLTVCFPAIYKMIAAKKAAAVAAGKSTALLNISDQVAHFADLTVRNIDATMSPELAKRAEDGVLDKNDVAALRQLGVDQLKMLLGPKGVEDIAKTLGTPAAPAPAVTVDQFLVSHVEKAVDTKNELSAT